MIEIAIPVKPYVMKYLIHKYSSDTITFKRNDHIHSTFLSLLQRPSKEYAHKKYKKVEGPNVKFVISMSLKRNVGCVLPEENIRHFNFFIDYLIKHEFFDFVDSKIEEGVRTKNAIDAFMDKYDLGEDDIKFETLKKSYYRYEIEKNQKNVSGNCPVNFTSKRAA
jgi:hypothetical protein